MKITTQNRWVLALIVIGGIIGAWHLRWVCDDAFISYRYAENLAGGYGLVFNHGEKVEGYTNFLWTLVLSIASSSGFPLPQSSMILGLSCWALALLGLSWRNDGWTITATIGAACCYHLRIFATPGGIFGNNGDRYIRFSLCANQDVLEKSLKRIKTIKQKVLCE